MQEHDIAGTAFAEVIADSYTWFATEAFWSKECGKNGVDKEFGEPEENDAKDPACGDSTCKDAVPILAPPQ